MVATKIIQDGQNRMAKPTKGNKYGTEQKTIRDKSACIDLQSIMGNPTSIGALSIAGGDLYSSTLEEIQKPINQSNRNRHKAIKAAVEHLLHENLVDKHEAKQMNKICKIIFAVDRGKENIINARKKIVYIYHQLLITCKQDSLAIVLASIFANENGPLKPFVPDVPEGTLAVASARDTRLLILGGTLGGMVIGARLGGIAGVAGATAEGE